MAIIASDQISIVDVTDGAAGDTGVGVSSVTPEYYLSTSKTTQTGGSWTTTPPTWSTGKYLWVRQVITYTDSTIERTTPYCDSSWEAVNEVEVGSRNLLLNTKSFIEASSTSLNGSLISGVSLLEDKYRDLAIRGCTLTTSVTEVCRYNFTDFNLGDTFTFSFYAKGDVSELRAFFYGASGYVQVANSVNCQGETSTNVDGRLSFYITSDWQRYWVTWTLKSTGDISIPKYVMIRTNGATSGQTVYVCGCKLEVGNKATDWNPAPEDVESDATKKANEAAKTATNYLHFDDDGLVIGNMTADTLGRNVLIDSDSVDIRNGSDVLASYGLYTTIGGTTGKHIFIDDDSVDIKNGETVLSQFTDNAIYLGKNSRSSTIDLCNGTGSIYNSTENNSYLEVSVLTIESDDIVELTTGHGVLSKATYRNDSWRSEATIGVGATAANFWDVGSMTSAPTPKGNISLIAKTSYISDVRKRKESGLYLTGDSASLTVRGLSVLSDPGTSCGIWLDGSLSKSTIRISSDETTITGTLVLSKTQDASGTADNSPALIVGGTASSAHLEFDANEIMAKSDGTTPSTLTLNNDGGNVYIGNKGTGNLFGICQVVTQGSLSPSNGATTTATVSYKSGRTKVLIEMWTTGSSGYYNSVYKTISSSMTAVTTTTLTNIGNSVGRYSISAAGVITLYNVTSASPTTVGVVYYRVTHFN